MREYTGRQYIAFDIASNFSGDLDKQDWEDRLAWVNDNQDNLEALESKAENPALFFAGVQAYRASQEGRPSGYPISLDATASGLQILSALTGCAKSASLCNLVSTGHRENPYMRLYGSVMQRAGGTVSLQYPPVKNAIMTAFYTSKAEPKKVFGEGDLLNTFYGTMRDEAPGAWALNEYMEQAWNPTVSQYDWYLPDGFHVIQKIEAKVEEWVHFMNEPYKVQFNVNAPTPKGRSLGANMTHSVDAFINREMHRRCNFNLESIQETIVNVKGKGTSTDRPKDTKLMEVWNRYEATGFLSLRIADFVDRNNAGLIDGVKVLELIRTLPKKPFKLLSVHDCFRALPNYGNDVRRQYNQIMSEVAGSNMLQDMLRQIKKKPSLTINKLSDLSKVILEADYALS